MTPAEIAVITWLIDKATGGIFTEYIKRAWFGKFHKQEDKTKVIERELQTVIFNYTQLESDAQALRKQNGELAQEVLKLRKENALLREKYVSPPPIDGGAISAPPPAR